MCDSDKSHVEAWKSMIDYQKTIISLSSAILAAVVGFYLTGNNVQLWPNMLAPVLILIASIIAACYGFGRSIKSVKTGNSETMAAHLSNLATGLLVVGILSAFLISPTDPQSVDYIVNKIEKETRNLNPVLETKQIESITFSSDIYTITYKTKSRTKSVRYSVKKKIILEIK